MCGIVGACDWGDRKVLEVMTDLLAHRGPDDRGVWESKREGGPWIGLGARRLSILDLSPAGHMPMSTPDGALTIIYNGECYNSPEIRRTLESAGHRFRSKGDTEVVLHAYQQWGPECLGRLNGMFAFAIWDERRNELFLARDHFGVKPLYYCQQGRRFAFASEIKALFPLPGMPRSLDQHALTQYLTFLWVPEPDTLFAGIRKLPPAHYAIWKAGELKIEKYWDLSFPEDGHHFPGCEADLVYDARQIWFQSVKRQMLSDVPIGAFLSAGMDSSSIVAALAHYSDHPVRTFTITSPKHQMVGEVTLDDASVARRTAESFGCKHSEIVVDARVVELLPKLIYHLDEPVADPAIIAAYLICREARKDTTVMLSGIGGDEVFGGYRKYRAHYLARYYQHIPATMRSHILEPMVQHLPSMRGTPLKGYVRLAKKMARSGSLAPQERFLTDSFYLPPDHLAQMLSPDLRSHMNGFRPDQTHTTHFRAVSNADFLNQMLYLDIKTFMVSLNLQYFDKMSMASSVEVRVPFLDRELVEWTAQNVPPAMKVRGGVLKYALRQAMRPWLSDEVLGQAKAGFGVPVDFWLTHDLREMVDDLLGEQALRKRGLLEPGPVAEMVREHREGREDWSLQVWSLLALELWMREFLKAPASVH